MCINYSSLKYSEFILAFQLQFGIYEAETGHFRWEKKTPFQRVVFQISKPFIFCYLAVDRFLKLVSEEILNNLYVFKAATYVK